MAGFFHGKQDMTSMPQPLIPHQAPALGSALHGLRRAWRALACVLLAVLLAGLLGACASGPEPEVATIAPRAPTPWDIASVREGLQTGQAESAASHWQHLTYPGKTSNQFAYLPVDGRRAMGVRSSSAVSMCAKP